MEVLQTSPLPLGYAAPQDRKIAETGTLTHASRTGNSESSLQSAEYARRARIDTLGQFCANDFDARASHGGFYAHRPNQGRTSDRHRGPLYGRTVGLFAQALRERHPRPWLDETIGRVGDACAALEPGLAAQGRRNRKLRRGAG